MSIAFNCDPKLPVIPNWLMDIALKKEITIMIDKMILPETYFNDLVKER